MPLPTGRLIHPRLAEHIGSVSNRAQTGLGTVTRAGTGEGTYDVGSGQTTPPAPTTQYAGSVRVQPRTGTDRVVVVGGQPVTVRLYDVQLPLTTADVAVDDVLILDQCDDPWLIGKRLEVTDVYGSSLPAQRDLVCLHRLG